jgi:DNA-directed RNA polymerase specialized sigma24 family protein
MTRSWLFGAMPLSFAATRLSRPGFSALPTVQRWCRCVARETTLPRAALIECPEQSADPVGDTEVQDWVEQGLEHLPDEQRLAVELTYNMGHSVGEIARISGAPFGTDKTRMFHARKKLRQYHPCSRDIRDWYGRVHHRRHTAADRA